MVDVLFQIIYYKLIYDKLVAIKVEEVLNLNQVWTRDKWGAENVAAQPYQKQGMGQTEQVLNALGQMKLTDEQLTARPWVAPIKFWKPWTPGQCRTDPKAKPCVIVNTAQRARRWVKLNKTLSPWVQTKQIQGQNLYNSELNVRAPRDQNGSSNPSARLKPPWGMILIENDLYVEV